MPSILMDMSEAIPVVDENDNIQYYITPNCNDCSSKSESSSLANISGQAIGYIPPATIGDKKMVLKSIALAEGEWDGTFFPWEEIKKSAGDLEGVPVNLVHGVTALGDTIVGKVLHAEPREIDLPGYGKVRGILAESRIDHPIAQELVLRGSIKGVSVRVHFDRDSDGDREIARNLRYEHLALADKPECKVCLNTDVVFKSLSEGNPNIVFIKPDREGGSEKDMGEVSGLDIGDVEVYTQDEIDLANAIKENPCEYLLDYEIEELSEGDIAHIAELAKWSVRYINDLPDSAFIFVRPGRKDAEGKTVPRTNRFFPYKDKTGKIDRVHLKNALQRFKQAKLTDEERRIALKKLCSVVKKVGMRSTLCEGKSLSDVDTGIENVKDMSEEVSVSENKDVGKDVSGDVDRREDASVKTVDKQETVEKQDATVKQEVHEDKSSTGYVSERFVTDLIDRLEKMMDRKIKEAVESAVKVEDEVENKEIESKEASTAEVSNTPENTVEETGKKVSIWEAHRIEDIDLDKTTAGDVLLAAHLAEKRDKGRVEVAISR